MRTSNLRLSVLSFVLLTSCTSLFAYAVEDISAAVNLLKRSAAAHGLNDTDAVPGARFKIDAPVLDYGQGLNPASPTTVHVSEYITFDLQNNRIRVSQQYDWGDTQFGSERTRQLSDPAEWNAYFREIRRMPHLVLYHALQASADIRPVNLAEGHVTAIVAGRTLDIFVDTETGLVRATRFPFASLRYGDAFIETVYADYDTTAELVWPTRVRQTEAGQETLNAEFEIYEISSFDVPPPPPEAQSERASQQTPERSARPIAEGITLFTGVGGRDYNALVLETNRGLAVIEAPISAESGASLADRIHAHYPANTSIRFLIPTHHHDDHSGGLPGLVAQAKSEQVTVVAATANHALFSQMISAPRTLAGLPDVQVKLNLITPENAKLTVKGKAVAVEDIGPTSHAQNHLIIRIGEDQPIIFQGDLTVFGHDGSVEPARKQTCEFARVLEQKGIEEATIVGAHGRMGTMQDLRQAVAQSPDLCSNN